MKKIALLLLSAFVLNASMAQMDKPVQVGGAPMFATKNIIQNAVNSKDHTTLVAAVKAANLVEVYKAPDLLQYSRQPMQHLINCLPEPWNHW
jgi:uncharacterized surface protein with fasciclin (FAS1) repeats